MDALELLKEDHEKVDDLFEQIEEAEESENGKSDKLRLFELIKTELETHTRIEETVFYPACKQYEKLRGMVEEALEEHKLVKTLLTELSAMNEGSEVFDAKLKVLQDNVEHHVDEEEDDLFPKVRDEMSQDQIDQLGAALEAAKSE